MSAVAEDAKPEDAKPESEKKIYYCEVCKVPCMSSISLQSHYRGMKHRKKEEALRFKTVYCFPAPFRTTMSYETQRPVKRGFMKDIMCLKDFINDPKREEPLVGLEHVVEIRFEGRREPHYECKLCGFNTEMAPMIEHLSGYKHRRAYISKEFPDKMKRKTTDVKECKVSFLKRIAGELEKSEGLKMYKIEGYIRPSTSPPSKKKARWEDDHKHENDPFWKQKALEFLVRMSNDCDKNLETFRITSDSEATRVVRVTQELTEALKSFCEKKAAVNYTNRLRPWMSASRGGFPGRRNFSRPYKPYGKYRGNSNWNQGFSSQYEQCAADGSFAPANTHGYRTDDGSSSYGLRPADSAVMSALRDSLALQTGSSAGGMSEWLRQFSQSASNSNPAPGGSSYVTGSVSEYSAEYMSKDEQGNNLPGNRMPYGRGGMSWRNQQMRTKARSITDQRSPYASFSYPSSGVYSTNYVSQSYFSYNSDGSVSSCTSTNFAFSRRGGSRWNQNSRWNRCPSWNREPNWNQDSGWNREPDNWNRESDNWNQDSSWSRDPNNWNQDSSWNKESENWNQDSSWNRESKNWNQDSRCQEYRHAKSSYKNDWGSHHYSFPGSGSYRDKEQFRSSDKTFDEDAVGSAPHVLNRLEGKDIPTMTGVLRQLASCYPALN